MSHRILSPSLTRCYGMVRRRRRTRSPVALARSAHGTDDAPAGVRCVRLCPRCVRRGQDGGVMVVSPDTPGQSGDGCVRVLSICCIYIFSFIGHRTLRNCSSALKFRL